MLQSNVICKYLSQNKGAEKKQWASSLKKLIKGGLDHREVSDWNCAVLCSSVWVLVGQTPSWAKSAPQKWVLQLLRDTLAWLEVTSSLTSVL